MQLDIKIPTELKDIWLGTYQDFLKVVENSNDDELIYNKMVQIFCGIELKDVLKIRWSDVQNITVKINEAFQEKPEFKKTFKLQGIEFGFIPYLEDITFGEYIDLSNNINDMENFHKAMAVMYRPIIENKKDKYLIEPYVSSANYSEVMKYVTIDIALGAKVFFCDLQKQLLNNTLLFLQKEMRQMNKKKISVAEEYLPNNGAGTQVSMQSLMVTLQNLARSQSYHYGSVLPSYLLKSKKEILSIVNSKNN